MAALVIWLEFRLSKWPATVWNPFPVLEVVLFQQELRRALANFGRNPLWGLGKQEQVESTFGEIVLAATTLAAQRTGAILVIEREMGLRSYIETGIALDALLTYDLLISIFNPGTPLHDGAVVIQGNRVAAAACFLPLTVNPALSRELGSRHRAAIGVTEDTDALAVVVSEETGGISVVVGGNSRRNVDGRALKQALLEGLEVQEAVSEPEGAPHTLPARDK